MKRESKQVVAMAIAALCAVPLMGCETMGDGIQADDAAEAMTRTRVLAELREAERLGLITLGEESIPWFTDEQNRLIALAGETAVTGQTLANKAK